MVKSRMAWNIRSCGIVFLIFLSFYLYSGHNITGEPPLEILIAWEVCIWFVAFPLLLIAVENPFNISMQSFQKRKEKLKAIKKKKRDEEFDKWLMECALYNCPYCNSKNEITDYEVCAFCGKPNPRQFQSDN